MPTRHFRPLEISREEHRLIKKKPLVLEPVNYMFENANSKAIVRVDANAVVIESLYVTPEFRGKKYGEALLKQIESFAREQGKVKIKVLSGKVRDDPDHSYGFYLRHGFIVDSSKVSKIGLKARLILNLPIPMYKPLI